MSRKTEHRVTGSAERRGALAQPRSAETDRRSRGGLSRRALTASGTCSPGRDQLELAERMHRRPRILAQFGIGSAVCATPTSRGEFIASRSCSASQRRRDRRVDSPHERRGCRYPAAGRLAGLQRAGGHGYRDDRLDDEVPEYFEGIDPDMADVERASIAANLRAVAHGLGHGRALPDRLPPGAVDEALLAADEGLPWVAVLRTYTIGHASLWEQSALKWSAGDFRTRGGSRRSGSSRGTCSRTLTWSRGNSLRCTKPSVTGCCAARSAGARR